MKEPEDLPKELPEHSQAKPTLKALEDATIVDDPAMLPESLADFSTESTITSSPDYVPNYIVNSPPRRRPADRTPNLADALIFILFLAMGFLVTLCGFGIALHFHLFGIKNLTDIQSDTRVTLGTQLLIYLVALAGAIPFFSLAWGRSFLSGVRWHAATALRLRWRLIFIAFAGNMLAAVGNFVLPFPRHAPIDQMFQTPLQAWVLFAFGVTIAPFVEELIFRGFLVPALATTWDWCGERLTGTSPRLPDAQGNPDWSLPAMVFAALAASAPFALMHSTQVGQAWGPLLVLYCVSLLLCSVRLATRSLAASTMVHSAYNLMLFGIMLYETDGFRHLDKLSGS